MEYLLKSTLISSSIYLFYKLFLTKETFFQSIRWYFLIGMAISLLLPLLIIPIYIEALPFVQPDTLTTMPALFQTPIIQSELVQTPIEEPFNWMGFTSIIYIVGIVFLGLKFLFELFSLFRLVKKSTKKKMQNYYFVETDNTISPFSFFNCIVYNKKQFSKEELDDIISHEKVHVNQKHSIDNILIQLFVVFQWFNPFVWMYKKDLQQNLEYIADKTAQEKSLNTKKYQYLLLKTSIKNNPFALSNNFFNSHLKKRIMMLQKSQTKKLNQLKYVLLLPLIALFLYSFNTKEVFVVKEQQILKNQPKFIIPIDKYNIKSVSGYGMRVNPFTKKKSLHKGIDYNAYENMDVYAAADGEVVKTGFDNEKGNFIEVKHDNGFQTNYQHLGNIQVAKYEKVKSGEIIGIVGNTGKSVVPHLHFEILKDGKNVNPKNLLAFNPKKNNILIINASTTQDEINSINNQFKNKYTKIKFDKVRRNKKGQIIALVIKTNFNNQNSYFKNMVIESQDNSTIKDLKVETINKTFKVRVGNTKDYTIISKDGIQLFGQDHNISNKRSAQVVKNKIKTQNNKNQYRVKKGDTFYTIAKKFNMNVEALKKLNSGLNNHLVEGLYILIKVEKPLVRKNELSSVNIKDQNEVNNVVLSNEIQNIASQPKSGYLSYKNNTYYYSINNNEVTFFTRFGEKPLDKLSKELLTILNKEKNESYSLVTINNDEKNTGWLYYNDKTYFYLITKNKVAFYTKYGTKPHIDINKELLTILNKEKNKSYSLVVVENNGKSYNGYLSYNNEQYFYTKINGELVFLDKFGNSVSSNLQKKLLVKFEEDISNYIKYKGKFYFYVYEDGKYIFNDEYVNDGLNKELNRTIKKQRLERRVKKRKKWGLPTTKFKPEHKIGNVFYNGETYIYSQDIHTNFGCQNCNDLIKQLSKTDRLKRKKITTKSGFTVFQYMDISPTIFYDRYGKTVNDIKLIDKLFNKLNEN